MAQAGYTPIQLYFSTTAAAVPLAANLAQGELAINIADGKLYYENSSGVVTLLASSTTVTNSFSAGTTGFTPSTATTGAVTLGGTLITSNGGTGLASYTAGDLSYYASGTALTKLAIGTAGQILTSTGTAPQWSTLSGVAVTTFSAGTTGFTPSSATSGAVTLAGTLATTNGGTGLTSFTANGVVYASSTSALATGSALTFDGAVFTAGTLGDLVVDSTNKIVYVGRQSGVSGDNSKLFVRDRVGNGLTISGATGAEGTGLFRPNADILGFSIASSERMRLDSTSLIIDTSTGGGRMTFSPGATRNQILSTTASFAAYNILRNQASSYEWLNTSSSQIMTLTAGGALGLNVTSPGSIIEVEDAAGATRITVRNTANSAAGAGINMLVTNSGTVVGNATIRVNNTDDIEFFTSVGKRVEFDSAGRVGFGSNGTTSDRFADMSFTGATTTGITQFGLVLNPTYPTTPTANIFNLYSNPNLTAGTTVTNVFGYYLEAINATGSTVTNKYGIYQAGASDQNYFAGNVGVGTTTMNGKFNSTPIPGFDATTTTWAQAALSTQGSFGGGLSLIDGSAGHLLHEINNGLDLAIRQGTVGSTSAEKLRITTNVISLSGLQGIEFQATQSASGNVNTLDDYEEGYWFPVLTPASGTITVTGGNTKGAYTKVGRLVTVTGNTAYSSSSASGEITLSGLPFAVNTSLDETSERFSGGVMLSGFTTGDGYGVFACDSGTSGSLRTSTLTNPVPDASVEIYISFSYFTT